MLQAAVAIDDEDDNNKIKYFFEFGFSNERWKRCETSVLGSNY